MESLLVDVRHSLRGLRRAPGLVVLATLALAMGIGFPTTMFSIVRGATRPLPFADADELVVVTRATPTIPDLQPKAWDFVEWTRRQGSLEELAAFVSEPVNLAGPGLRPERHDGAYITPNTFGILGVVPLLGRGLQHSDAVAGAERVVILGHSVWQNRYAGEVGVLGREIRVDGVPHTVVGVMPDRFGFPVNSQLWLPLHVAGSPQPDEGAYLRVFGRLRDDVPLERARTELATLAAAIGRDEPVHHGDQTIRALPFVEIEMDTSMTWVLHFMVGVVSLVLLVACANVANLLLARAATRTREVAVRTALGASRRRIVGQQLVETAVIALAGGVLGLLAAHAGVRWFAGMSSEILQAFWIDFRIDRAVLFFTAALVAVAAIAAGIGPGLQATRGDVASALKDSTGGTSSMRLGRISRTLVVSEIALSCGMLVLAAIMVRAAVSLRAVDLPFAAERVVTAQLALTQETLDDAESRNLLFRGLLERLDATPGLGPTALASAVPGRGGGSWSFALDGATWASPAAMPSTRVSFITPGFLEVLDARVLQGRALTSGDDAGAAPVALVNESFVRRFSPDADPLGRRVRIGSAGEDRTIVGVVPDLQMQDVDQPLGDGIYVPLLQARPYQVRVLARPAGPPLGAVAGLRNAVEATHPDLPVFEIATLRAAMFADKRILDAFATLFLLFGTGALLLTSAGLYGMIAFAVTQRTRELGIRMALGARRRDVVALVLRQGGRQLAIGFGLGLALAAAVARVIASALEFVDPSDPLVYGAVFGTLALAGVAALIVPARRAAAVTPLEALRRE